MEFTSDEIYHWCLLTFYSPTFYFILFCSLKYIWNTFFSFYYILTSELCAYSPFVNLWSKRTNSWLAKKKNHPMDPFSKPWSRVIRYMVHTTKLNSTDDHSNIWGIHIMQRCQLVRFTRTPYGFLRFTRSHGRTMQSLRIFIIFADSNLGPTIIPRFIFELLSVCNDTSYASWTRK